MSILNWLLNKLVKKPVEKSPEDTKSENVYDNGAKAVILEEPVVSIKVEQEVSQEIESVVLTETELLESYKKAMQLKKEGNVLEAEKLLMKSCMPASVYKGHYKELFKIWRQYNRDDLKAEKYRKVLDRVLKMLKLDEEMIAEMLLYWGAQQHKELPEDYFDADRNLLVSDVKALRVAAEALQENKNVELADSLMKRFSKK